MGHRRVMSPISNERSKKKLVPVPDSFVPPTKKNLSTHISAVMLAVLVAVLAANEATAEVTAILVKERKWW